MSWLPRELRQAAIRLAKDPGYALVALVTLALAIGANAAIFSVVNTVLLQPLPYADSDRLVTVYNVYPGVGVDFGSNSVPDYLDRRQLTETFSDMALLSYGSRNIGEEGSPERVAALEVTPSLFPLLGVEPLLGRTFDEAEAVIGGEPVVVLGHEVWQSRFGGDPAVVGQDLRVDGQPFRVIGVMPEGFAPLDPEVRLFFPFAFTEEQMSDDSRHSNFAPMLGRLAPGVSVERAQRAIDELNARNAERFPEMQEILETTRFATVVRGLQERQVAAVRPALWLLLAAVLCVLLIGCVNIANLMLVRASGRRKELAIRFALGAGRWRVARGLLIESLLLSLAGGAAGLALAVGGLGLLDHFGVDRLPRGAEVSIDLAVVGFAFVLAVITGLLFGLVPVAQVMRRDLTDAFRDSTRGASAGRRVGTARAALVVAQVALAFVLLIGAGLLLTSFDRVLAVDPGFEPEGVVTAYLSLPESRYSEDEQLATLQRRLLDEVGAVPGVEAVGLTSMLPFGGGNNASVISIEGHELAPGEGPPVPHYAAIGGDYLEVMGIPLLRGRGFTPGDDAEANPVVLVDRQLAERYWPDGDVVGGRLRSGMADPKGEDPEEEVIWYTVAGVVGDVLSQDLAQPDPVGAVYFHYAQQPRSFAALVLDPGERGPAVIEDVRRAVLGLDPSLPLFSVKTMQERVAESLADRRTPMLLLGLFAAVALLLSVVGVYGVLAYAVRQRTREIGIRMALGAERGRVLGQVMWLGSRVVLLGLATGLTVAVAGGRVVRGLLYGVEPTEPAVYATVAALLAAAAAIACLLPSLRATRVDPTVALRHE